MTKKDLINTLEAQPKEHDFYYRGDYHDIGKSELSDILDMLDDDAEYILDSDVVDELQYDGSISEYADSATPIYYNDIAKWFGENWSAVDECLDELGGPATRSNGKREETDIMKTIQMAHCWSYERDIQSALNALFKEVEENEVTTK